MSNAENKYKILPHQLRLTASLKQFGKRIYFPARRVATDMPASTHSTYTIDDVLFLLCILVRFFLYFTEAE